MGATKTCKRCGLESQSAFGKCSGCGATMNPFYSAGAVAAAIIAAILLLSGVIVWKIVARSAHSEKPPSRVTAVVEPAPVGSPVIKIPDVMSMEYQDAGSSVVIKIASPGMPILLADTNHDGKIDDRGTDLSFAAKPDGAICVQRFNLSEIGVCGQVPTAATASVEGGPGDWTITFKIPKNELSIEANDAHIAIEIFDEQTQRGSFYPAAPFARVYDLHFVPHSPPQPVDVRAISDSRTPAPALFPAEKPPTVGSANSQAPRASPAGQGHETKAVPVLPVIDIFQSATEVTERGSGVVLRWKTTNATGVKLEPDSDLGILPLQGERTIYPQESSRYTLTAEGPGGSVSSHLLVRVTVPSPPVISAFRAESATINKGGITTLRWTVSGATNVKIAPGWDSLPLQGEVQISPEQTTQYVLSANNPGGTVSDQLTVRVTPISQPVISMYADPPSVAEGGTSTIHWKVNDASHVSIDPDLGAQNSEGSAIVHPQRTTQYTLTASGPGGTTTRTLTITVTLPGPTAGELVWRGIVNGTQLLTIDRDRATFGELQGSLPGVPCIIQPINEKRVSVAAAPSPRNNYERLVLRINGNGPMTVVVKWSLQ